MRPTRLATRKLDPILACSFALGLAALALTGCSRGMLVAPETEVAPVSTASDVQPPAPPSRLSVPPDSSSDLRGLGGVSSTVLDWQLIASVLVRTGVDQQVQGGRYTLHFSRSSLEKNEIVIIKSYDANTLDVQFGPHGTLFKTPVELSIDFSGTAADPGSRVADASEPVLWYLDETRNEWFEIPGTVDWANKRYVVRLEHFSRYVLGGKAGWKHAPRHDSAE